MQSVGRNDPCPCGSGKRAKHCCLRLAPDRAPDTSATDASPPGASPAPGTGAPLRDAGDAGVQLARANALLARGDLAGAAAQIESALARDPRFAEAHFALAQVLWAQGHPDLAAAQLERGLALKPNVAEAHNNMGILHDALGRPGAAIASFRRALALKPDFAWAHCNLGNVLQGQRELDAAIASYRRALAIDPDNFGGHANLGRALQAQDDLDAAVASYEKALALRPDRAEAHVNLAGALQARGDLAPAIDAYRRALAQKPDFAEAHSGLLFAMSFNPVFSPDERLAEARRFGARALARARPYTRWAADAAAPADRGGRPLRLGLVSGDLRSHPVGFFIESILAHLDPTRIELVAYPTIPQEDDTTARVRRGIPAWNSIAHLGDDAAAARIHADGIDVLVDLAGHTGHNRLPVFAWKPAPVQASWLGYFGTTGVPGIDFLLADRVSVPDAHRAQFTEAVWCLPDSRFCFTPPAAGMRLAPTPLPATRNGYVTFGAFQNPTKLSDAVLGAWGRVMQALPQARLRLQNSQMGFPAARTRMQERLRRVGIAPDRVTLVGQVPREDYLAAHADVDIILDTFPYTGGTTTCEALWMGVPTLTLAGDTMVSRQGATLLACAGLGDWIAADEPSYVACAIAQATDLGRLATLRSELRAKLLASPLTDAPRFARHLEDALHGIWARERPG